MINSNEKSIVKCKNTHNKKNKQSRLWSKLATFSHARIKWFLIFFAYLTENEKVLCSKGLRNSIPSKALTITTF